MTNGSFRVKKVIKILSQVECNQLKQKRLSDVKLSRMWSNMTKGCQIMSYEVKSGQMVFKGTSMRSVQMRI